MKSWRCVGMALVLQLVASPAYATATYVDELLEYYVVETLPVGGDGCMLCHSDDKGGTMTIETPYGRALRGYGALGNNLPSLQSALVEAENRGQDSDGDGASDVDEIIGGTDPNVAPEGVESSVPDVPLAQTGCTVTRASSDASKTGAQLAFVGLAMLVALLRRRAR